MRWTFFLIAIYSLSRHGAASPSYTTPFTVDCTTPLDSPTCGRLVSDPCWLKVGPDTGFELANTVRVWYQQLDVESEACFVNNCPDFRSEELNFVVADTTGLGSEIQISVHGVTQLCGHACSAASGGPFSGICQPLPGYCSHGVVSLPDECPGSDPAAVGMLKIIMGYRLYQDCEDVVDKSCGSEKACEVGFSSTNVGGFKVGDAMHGQYYQDVIPDEPLCVGDCDQVTGQLTFQNYDAYSLRMVEAQLPGDDEAAFHMWSASFTLGQACTTTEDHAPFSGILQNRVEDCVAYDRPPDCPQGPDPPGVRSRGFATFTYIQGGPSDLKVNCDSWVEIGDCGTVRNPCPAIVPAGFHSELGDLLFYKHNNTGGQLGPCGSDPCPAFVSAPLFIKVEAVHEESAVTVGYGALKTMCPAACLDVDGTFRDACQASVDDCGSQGALEACPAGTIHQSLQPPDFLGDYRFDMRIDCSAPSEEGCGTNEFPCKAGVPQASGFAVGDIVLAVYAQPSSPERHCLAGCDAFRSNEVYLEVSEVLYGSETSDLYEVFMFEISFDGLNAFCPYPCSRNSKGLYHCSHTTDLCGDETLSTCEEGLYAPGRLDSLLLYVEPTFPWSTAPDDQEPTESPDPTSSTTPATSSPTTTTTSTSANPSEVGTTTSGSAAALLSGLKCTILPFLAATAL